MRWLRAHAAEYHLDPDKIAAWGSSAGGHLAAMLGTSGDVQTLEDLSLGNPGQSSRVQAVIDIIWLMIVHLIGERNRKGTPGSYYGVKDY